MKKILLILMTFVLCFGSTLTAFASENEPAVISANVSDEFVKTFLETHWTPSKSSYPYAFVVDNYDIYGGDQGTFVYISKNEPYWDSEKSRIVIVGSGKEFRNLKETDSGLSNPSVDVLSNSIDHNISIGKGTESVRWTSADILDSEGESVYTHDPNFFLPPAPMAQRILEVVGKELTEETTPAVAKVMVSLTACGIGLIALLIGLKVLPKVFYRFLG